MKRGRTRSTLGRRPGEAWAKLARGLCPHRRRRRHRLHHLSKHRGARSKQRAWRSALSASRPARRRAASRRTAKRTQANPAPNARQTARFRREPLISPDHRRTAPSSTGGTDRESSRNVAYRGPPHPALEGRWEYAARALSKQLTFRSSAEAIHGENVTKPSGARPNDECEGNRRGR